MATGTILDVLIPSFFARDVVAVYTQDFNQVFAQARPLKVVVKEEAKVMEHPVENGTIITDHRIILPVEIELSMLIRNADYPDVYQAIRQFYLNATLLVVQTKVGIYDNQMIASMPHEEDPEHFDTITLALKFKQVQFVTPVYGVVPKRPAHSNTSALGVQQPKPLTSVASNGFDALKRKFGISK